MSYPNPNPNPILGHNFIALDTISYRNLYIKYCPGGLFEIGHYYILHIHVYRRCIWMLYTCILIMHIGDIYMYCDGVYGCYIYMFITYLVQIKAFLYD
jgi:hypothetical protein